MAKFEPLLMTAEKWLFWALFLTVLFYGRPLPLPSKKLSNVGVAISSSELERGPSNGVQSALELCPSINSKCEFREE